MSAPLRCRRGVTIKGPLTGLPCAWWQYEIEDAVASARGAAGRPSTRQTSETPFLLDDGTGRCLVDPRGAEVITHTRTVWYGATPWPEYRLPPTGPAFFGKLFDALMSGGRYRYTERRLDIDEPVYALGEFRTGGGIGIDGPGGRGRAAAA